MTKENEIDEPISKVEIKYVMSTKGLSRETHGASAEATMLGIIIEFFTTKNGCTLTIATASTETIFIRHLGGRVFRKIRLIPT